MVCHCTVPPHVLARMVQLRQCRRRGLSAAAHSRPEMRVCALQYRSPQRQRRSMCSSVRPLRSTEAARLATPDALSCAHHAANRRCARPDDPMPARNRRPALSAAVLALTAGGLWWWQARRTANAAPNYSTQAVARGNLTLTVTANGTLQPTRSTNIGSELSGTVLKVNVDVNDLIRKGQARVELDTAKLRDQILRSRAVLAAATAKVTQTLTTVKEATADLARLEEVARISAGQLPAGTELDTGHAALERATADAASARAGVSDAQAALALDEINLSKASIRAPSDGVVLTRTVDTGNAVAASLQRVRVRSVIAVARFLKWLPVRAVWCEMFLPDHAWSRPRLILATETDLSARQVVEIYAERRGIEPLFHHLKRWWGVANLWQQSKAALELWMQIRSTAYALTQLLALQLWESFPLMAIAPWRKSAMITAGLLPSGCGFHLSDFPCPTPTTRSPVNW